jgi:DNA polymerase
VTGVGAARDWTALAEAMRSCVACPELAATRTQVVVGSAAAGARMLLVGEAPGATEDEAGEPFIGRGGRLLDELLSAAGLDRGRVAVSNVLKCRPPANRTPTPAEMGRCRHWLDDQVHVVGPDVVVTLGGTAARWAFGRSVRLGDVRGRAHRLPVAPGALLVPTYHPSAALRFGPNGEPARLLAADLVHAAGLLG